MRVVLIDPPPHLLVERRRLGQDIRDEMWGGVVHVVPPSSSRHQRLAHNLGAVLFPLADARDLIAMHEAGIFRPSQARDWRVPDLIYARSQYVSERGVEGRAELVVEIRSPGDETYDKLPFYAGLRCQEVLVIDRDSFVVELFSLEGDAFSRATGPVRLTSLGTTIATIDGPGLRVTWDGRSADVVV